MYDDIIIEKFKEELMEYTLNFCKSGQILNKLDKSTDDFSTISELIIFLNDYKDEFPSLNWSLKYYYTFEDDFNTINEFYVMLTEFEFSYRFTEMDIPSCDDFFNELMDEFKDCLFKKYHDSYDLWDQYGPNSYHI